MALLLTASGVAVSAIPRAAIGMAELLIGIGLGVRFTREFVYQAPRWLGSVAVAT